MAEREMLDRLLVRYGTTFAKATYSTRRYMRAEHVGFEPHNKTGNRIADFVAVDMFNSSDRVEGALGRQSIHWHEVKCTRADLLTELATPEKSQLWRDHSHYWWLVLSRDVFLHEGELPEGWGLMVQHGRSVRVAVKAPRHDALPMPVPILASLLRATVETERRALELDHRAAVGGEDVLQGGVQQHGGPFVLAGQAPGGNLVQVT